MQVAANEQFRFRVLATDPAHDIASLLFLEDVSQNMVPSNLALTVLLCTHLISDSPEWTRSATSQLLEG